MSKMSGVDKERGFETKDNARSEGRVGWVESTQEERGWCPPYTQHFLL